MKINWNFKKFLMICQNLDNGAHIILRHKKGTIGNYVVIILTHEQEQAD
jgi:hypothetical protein